MSDKHSIKKYVPITSFISTVITIIVLYLTKIPNPNIILITLIVYFTFLGGYISGAISCLLTITYSLVFFSSSGHLLRYSPDNWKRVLISCIFMPIMILIVGSLKNDLIKKTRDLELINETLSFSSNHDFLTGIHNRRYFDEAITKEWFRAIREQKPISIIMVDIDYFKKFNDTYGHNTGDYCLKEVAKALIKEIKRAGDVSARFGGEEFAVILPNTNLEGARNIAENIRKSVEDLKIRFESSLVCDYLTVSVGLATMVPAKNSSYFELLNNADAALYIAKENGRNRVEMGSTMVPRL
ncbi:GGDEF domain-containing protein [Desulfosporosinus sp. FKA]|uniref:GGDEF domain-containing protein n=1 Tax=Desulfosporosinus sp. FKA TaxID=1969834 RepID=UPI000B49C256|nr:GGDEF domain-containing protein [Desulfosporosinus sp. FKA]